MLMAGAIGFVGTLAVSGMVRDDTIANPWTPGMILLSVAVTLTFAIRDVLFLQWCLLTKMKSPIPKGIGLLWLYYFAAAVVSSMFMRPTGTMTPGLIFLTPAAAFFSGAQIASAIPGLIFQVLVCGVILYLIQQRLIQMQERTAAAAA
jgi:hypothetical protein